jgi:hypothetical protein
MVLTFETVIGWYREGFRLLEAGREGSEAARQQKTFQESSRPDFRMVAKNATGSTAKFRILTPD